MDINEIQIGQRVAFVGIVREIRDGVVCVVDQSVPDSKIYRLFHPRFLSPWTSCPRETSRGYKARLYAEDWRPFSSQFREYDALFNASCPHAALDSEQSDKCEQGGSRDRSDAANLSYLAYMRGFEGCFPANEAGSIFGEVLKNRNTPSSSTQTTGNKAEEFPPPAPSLTRSIKDYREKFKAIMGGWDWESLKAVSEALHEEVDELSCLLDPVISGQSLDLHGIAAELADVIIVAVEWMQQLPGKSDDIGLTLERIIQGRIDSNLDRAERAREAAVLKDTEPKEEWRTTNRLFEI